MEIVILDIIALAVLFRLTLIMMRKVVNALVDIFALGAL